MRPLLLYLNLSRKGDEPSDAFDSCPRPCRQSRRKAHEAHRRPLEAVGLLRVPAGFPDLRRPAPPGPAPRRKGAGGQCRPGPAGPPGGGAALRTGGDDSPRDGGGRGPAAPVPGAGGTERRLLRLGPHPGDPAGLSGDVHAGPAGVLPAPGL